MAIGLSSSESAGKRLRFEEMWTPPERSGGVFLWPQGPPPSSSGAVPRIYCRESETARSQVRCRADLWCHRRRSKALFSTTRAFIPQCLVRRVGRKQSEVRPVFPGHSDVSVPERSLLPSSDLARPIALVSLRPTDTVREPKEALPAVDHPFWSDSIDKIVAEYLHVVQVYPSS